MDNIKWNNKQKGTYTHPDPQKTSFTAIGEDAPSLTIQEWKP